MRVKLEYVCERGSSNLKQTDVIDKTGEYPIYGAAGYIGNVDFYHQEKAYVAVVKDGAGIGRTTLHPAKSSVIGTMQYLLPKENVLPEYLCYVVRYMHLEKYFTGATIPHIYFKDYKNEEFNLDTLERQREIVNILKKVESIIESRQQELKKLDELIKARFVELFGDPMTNPKGFPIKTIEEVSVLNKGITYSPEDVADEGMIVLRSSNIKGNVFDLEDLVKITKKISPDKYVRENDILMCNRNGSARLVGKVAMIPKLDENMTFGTFMTVVRSEIHDYLFAFFQMEAFREQIKFQTAVAINQISLPLLASVKVPVPPKELVDEFETFIKQVDKSKFRKLCYIKFEKKKHYIYFFEERLISKGQLRY